MLINRFKRIKRLFLFTFAVILTPANLSAKQCSLAVTSLDFGQVAAGKGSGMTATASITVNCRSGLPYTLALDGGVNAGRMMIKGASFLPYEVNRDMTGLIWGDDGITIPGASVSGMGTGLDQVFTAYGILGANAGQVGLYLDTITVTLVY